MYPLAMATRAVLFLCLALLAAPGCSEEAGQDVSAQVEVLVVPIDGEVSVITVALVRRALREARSNGISRVVLEIDTPGGRLDSMLEVGGLLDAALRDNDVYTVGLVNSQALSAGAYIALACRETFMVPGATMGAITPVVMGLDGIAEIPDDDARMKIYAAIRADVRGLLERRGSEGSPYSEDALRIAEAMVDPSIRLFEVTYEQGGFETTEVVDADGRRN